VPGDYDLLQLTATNANASSETYGIVSTETDPRVITHKFVERFRANLAYTITQEWENCRCVMSHPMIIAYTSSSGVKMSEAIDGWSIDLGKTVYVGAFSRPADPNGPSLRDLYRKIAFQVPPAQYIPPPPPPPTPTIVSRDPLRDALSMRPFTPDDFPDRLFDLPTRVSSNPLDADIAFSFGNSNSVYIGYWVETDTNAAQAKLDEIATSLAKDNPSSATTIHVAQGSLIYHSGGTDAIYSIESRRVIVAAYIHSEGSISETVPYEIDKIAILHLYNVEKKVG